MNHQITQIMTTLLRKLNPTTRRGAYEISEFKKLYPNAYSDKSNGFVITFILNNMFRSKWVETEQQALNHVK